MRRCLPERRAGWCGGKCASAAVLLVAPLPALQAEAEKTVPLEVRPDVKHVEGGEAEVLVAGRWARRQAGCS